MLPLVATPVIRPLHTLRYFVRLGTNILNSLPLVDPNLNTNYTSWCLSRNGSIVNISPDSMKWHAALNFFFSSRHFSTIKTTGNFDSNSFCTGSHGSG